jgi:hypothetical protein
MFRPTNLEDGDLIPARLPQSKLPNHTPIALSLKPLFGRDTSARYSIDVICDL